MINNDKFMLTTLDNPHNPFDDFTSWYLFDVVKGYNTCGFIDRIAKTTNDMTDEEVDEEINRAIDEIIKYDFTNMYVKVKENQPINFEEWQKLEKELTSA